MQALTELLSYIPEISSYFLLAAVVFLFVSLFLVFRFPRSRWNYIYLFVSVALFGFGFALIDDFLHPWDEQFHALVAKNLSNHPLHPTLLEGSRKVFDMSAWVDNNTWLHKQPLFLWQIALSLKLFGTNLIALRLPSVLMHAASACMVFALGKRYLSFFFAVAASVLYGFSGFINDFISGAQGMDHNDIAFTFYVTASFWAWHKFSETGSRKWMVLVGLFSGGAVLCKWLVGFIVYAGWGLIVLLYERKNLHSWKQLLMAFGITVLVAAPWQIYCALVFPAEFQHEMSYNSLHFFTMVENHGGEFDFYFQGMKKIYGAGEVLRFFVLAGLLITFVKGIRNSDRQRVFAAVVFTIIYLFFMGAATKLEGYVLIAASFGFIFFVVPLEELIRLLNRKDLKMRYWLSPFFVLLILFLHFQPQGVTDRHFYKAPENINEWKKDLAEGTRRIQALPDNRVILVRNGELMAAALRFNTGKEIYPYHADLDKNGAIVIDLGNN